MKVLVLPVIFIFSLGMVFAEADVDQWKDTCTQKKGQFSVLKNGESDLSMCFFGEVGLGAEALSQLKNEGVTVDSVKAFKNGKAASPRGGVCGAFNAELVTAKDAGGQNYNLCKFADNSVMEETTLWLGPRGTSQDGLDKILTTVQ